MYTFRYLLVKKLGKELKPGRSFRIQQMSKCASHQQVLDQLKVINDEVKLEEFFSEPMKVNEEIAAGDFLIKRLK